MKKLIFVVFIISAFSSAAQKSINFEKWINSTSLQKHLRIIASDSMEGRETGTEGQRRAANYIQNQFASIGLSKSATLNGYQQFYPLWQQTIRKISVKANNEEAVFGRDILLRVQNNPAMNIKNRPIVFAGYGIDDDAYSDYININVTGKVLIIATGEPRIDGKYIISKTSKPGSWSKDISKKIGVAIAKGAVGVLIFNPQTDSFSNRYREYVTRNSVYYPSKVKEESIFVADITPGYAEKLLNIPVAALAKNGQLLNQQTFTANKQVDILFEKSKDTVYASNVIGIIEGTDKKNEYVFLTAHYDHLGKHDGKIYYGADDDGSGTCAVINIAEAFIKAKEAGYAPRRSIVFMTVSGEEKGLWGSEYYSNNPVFPLEKTSVDLNIDMIGRIDTERKKADTLNYVYVVGHDKISTELPVVNEYANKMYTGLTLDYKFDDPADTERIYFRSDHYNFARKGVPVLFFYDGMLLADYHRPTDTVDKINWSLYEKRARMIFHTAWEIANRDNLLKRDLPIPSEER